MPELRSEKMTVNMGPQHPSTHGVLRLVLELSGETVVGADTTIGYLHTGIEKTAEDKAYWKAIPVIERMDYLAYHFNAQAFCGAVETLLDLESVYTAPEDPWIQEVFEVMHGILGSRPEPRAATYFTDAAALNFAYGTPPTIVLGPGEAPLAHQTDEYCVVERIAESVAAYEEIARRWCKI